MEYWKKIRRIIEEEKRLYLSLVAGGLIFLVIGLLLALFYHPAISFERNRPGLGEENQKVVLKTGREKEEIEVAVGEKELSEKELDEAFDEAFAYVKQTLLGENPSLQEITENVGIIWSVPNTSITVSWEFEDESVLDMEGIVYNENLTEGYKITHLKATLRYEDSQKEAQRTRVYTLRICPKNRTKAGMLFHQATKEILRVEDATKEKETFVVPGNLGGVFVRKKGRKNRPLLMGGFLIFAAMLLILRKLEEEKNAYEERRLQAKLGYPDIIWQFVLLLEAGHTIPMAWNKIVDDYGKRKEGMSEAKRFVYEQMATAKRQMALGISYERVFSEFAQNVKLKPYSKLMTLFTQNMSKGSKNLLDILKEEEEQAFFERCEEAKRQGEEADTKLLLPMGLMLLDVLLLLMVPAYMQFV